MPLSTECAAALLSFRYPSIKGLKDKDFNSISDCDPYLLKRMQLFVNRYQILFLWFLYHDYSLKIPWINALPFNHACRLGRLHKLHHKNEIPVISLSCHSIGNLERFLSIFALQLCSCSLRIFLHKKIHFKFENRRELNATQEQAPGHLC